MGWNWNLIAASRKQLYYGSTTSNSLPLSRSDKTGESRCKRIIMSQLKLHITLHSMVEVCHAASCSLAWPNCVTLQPRRTSDGPELVSLSTQMHGGIDMASVVVVGRAGEEEEDSCCCSCRVVRNIWCGHVGDAIQF